DRTIQSKAKASTPKWHTWQSTLRVCVFSSGSPPRATYDHSEEAAPFNASIDRMPPPLLVALAQFGATSMLPMRLVRSMNAAATPSCKRYWRTVAAFLQHQRHNVRAVTPKSSTAASRLVEFQTAVKGFGLQTLDLARLCHACTLPRWRRVRRRHARRCLRGAGRGSSLRPADSRPLVLRRFVRSIDRARGGEL